MKEINYKAEPIKGKNSNETIAAKVRKESLEKDFDGYYERLAKYLGADRLKIEEYDEQKVVVYDRDKYSDK